MDNRTRTAFFKIPLHLFIFFLTLFTSCSQNSDKGKKPLPQNLLDVDFDRAMGSKDCPEYRIHFINDEANLLLFKKVYKTHKPSKVQAAKEPKIPKIIHHIWLGKKEIPRHLNEVSASFKKLHPDWEYHFWTDQRVRAFDFELKDLFYSQTAHEKNELKKDILRAELLDRFGGIVVDLDFELLEPLDSLHAKYDFYTACLAPQKENESMLSSALIGARPAHPLIKEWKKELCINHESSFEKAVCSKLADPSEINIVFPATYFYPISSQELTPWMKRRASFIKNCLQSFFEFLHIKKSIPFTKTKPETLAIYYWGGTLLKTNEEHFKELYQDLLEKQKELTYEVQKLQDELQRLREETAKMAFVKGTKI